VQGSVKPQVPPLRLRCGRDDNFMETTSSDSRWVCGPLKGMKMASVQQPLSKEASPSPLSSRLSRRAVGPEWSWACGPPKEMKNACRPATALYGSAALPFVIPTGAKRSGGICSSADLSWICFSTEGNGVGGPAVSTFVI
jgi:hypothetical protein